MRDEVIYGYFGVKIEGVWEVIKRDIPNLKPKFGERLMVGIFRATTSIPWCIASKSPNKSMYLTLLAKFPLRGNFTHPQLLGVIGLCSLGSNSNKNKTNGGESLGKK